MTDSMRAVEVLGGVESHYLAKAILEREKTPFQNLQIVDSLAYGKMLLLDNMVQTTERDEFIYHEMLTHVPLLAHPDPRRVLIIGGGDGGILREVLRHPTVERAVMVEIDQRVIDFCNEYLPSISADCYADPRAEVVIADGAAYLRDTTEKFDVVIVDSPDPIGPATVLFSREFYGNIRGVLTEAGVMVRQTGSTFLQPDEQRESYQLLRTIFPQSAMYVLAVPTYVGGFFSCMFCSMQVDPLQATEASLATRFAALGIRTKYYNPGVHVGAFQIPEYLKENINRA